MKTIQSYSFCLGKKIITEKVLNLAIKRLYFLFVEKPTELCWFPIYLAFFFLVDKQITRTVRVPNLFMKLLYNSLPLMMKCEPMLTWLYMGVWVTSHERILFPCIFLLETEMQLEGCEFEKGQGWWELMQLLPQPLVCLNLHLSRWLGFKEGKGQLANDYVASALWYFLWNK